MERSNKVGCRARPVHAPPETEEDPCPRPLRPARQESPARGRRRSPGAARSSLADASGIVWSFRQGGLRFELDGYVLEAADPGATIAFSDDGVLLTGFTLSPL